MVGAIVNVFYDENGNDIIIHRDTIITDSGLYKGFYLTCNGRIIWAGLNTYADAKRAAFKVFDDKNMNHDQYKRKCGHLDRSPCSDWVTCLHKDNPTALQVCSDEHCPVKKH